MRTSAAAALAAVVMVGLAGGALVYQLTSNPSRSGPEGAAGQESPEVVEPPPSDAGRTGSLEVFASKDPFAPAGEGARDDGLRIEMIGASGDTAHFRIGSGAGARELDAAPGDIFESYLQLLALDDGCAVLLFGDEQFSLCPGEGTVR